MLHKPRKERHKGLGTPVFITDRVKGSRKTCLMKRITDTAGRERLVLRTKPWSPTFQRPPEDLLQYQ